MSDLPFDSQNAAYAQLLYDEYALNPEGVPESWRHFFAQGPEVTQAAGLIVPEGLVERGPAPAAGNGNGAAAGHAAPSVSAGFGAGSLIDAGSVERLLPLVSRATSFVQAYRDHGHTQARINPLYAERTEHPQLDPSFFGTSMEELESLPASVILDEAQPGESVAGALHRFKTAYTGTIGYEFEHIDDPERVRWLWSVVESGRYAQPLEAPKRVKLLERLAQVEGFEQFLHRTYLGQKRFSIEGTDMMVPMLDLVVEEAAARGGRGVVLGMAHRGRLNVLTHILKVPYGDLIREFEGLKGKGALHVAGTGDVKYHHGARGTYDVGDDRTMEVVLAPNPSHLEFVNPVVVGMTRALQFGATGADAEQNPDAVLPVLIHGDAAFAAEGVVAETLNMARLEGYRVGGTIHIIANNQIGFTTTPCEGRSTRYSSDLAKGFDFPILHVNADDPEACLAAIRIAMAYRDQYHDDVVIDLVGYRRHGHNEGDEPSYTQPLLYHTIAEHPTVRALWAERLVSEGVLDEAGVQAIDDAVQTRLREEQDRVKSEAAAPSQETDDDEGGVPVEPDTAVAIERLQHIATAALEVPEGFKVHPKLARQLARRPEVLEPDSRLDWGFGEALAFGSLLEEGLVVRLTGQDAQRGTFSHRHLVLHDADTGELCTPLANLDHGRLEIFNSPLTESGVLGFEYGYSVASANDLVLWEGQFGDFVNVAQVAIDQFISSGREKWGQISNLTMLLPHGYEGQGPEHSSARLERFLQLCAEDNMRVAYPTTPAQHFHLLRRQATWRPERPLIVMTPKSLLRLPAASSTISELTSGTFQPVLDDARGSAERKGVERLLLCSGKIYYDLQGHARRAEAGSVAIARLEQLYPFPDERIAEVVQSYPKLKELVWVQEEPHNMGGLTFVLPRLRKVLPESIALHAVSRPERASPAEGKASDHAREQERIVLEALGI
jgi:2-oxoglutarate dehydrogenase E1 component